MTALPRVLVMSHMYPTEADPIGGVFIHQHVKAMKAHGVPVEVVCPVPWAPPPVTWLPRWQRYGGLEGTYHYEGVTVRRIRFPHVPIKLYQAIHGGSIAGAAIPAILALRRQFPFEVLHSHTLTPDGLAGIILGRLFQVPTVCSIRGSDINQYPSTSRLRHWTTRQVLDHSTRIAAVSGVVAGRATALSEGRIHPTVIYNGVDRERYHPREDDGAIRRRFGLPPEGRLAVFVGRCEEDKGIDELVTAFVGVAAEVDDVCLVMVGEGAERRAAETRLAEEGLSSRVAFTGRLAPPEAAEILGIASLFVLPSWTEGMPNAMLEAMASGVPSIVTPVGGVPEVLVDGDNGLSIPVRAPQAIGRAMLRLLGDEALARRIGARGLATIEERFSWERNARAHIELYQEVLKG